MAEAGFEKVPMEGIVQNSLEEWIVDRADPGASSWSTFPRGNSHPTRSCPFNSSERFLPSSGSASWADSGASRDRFNALLRWRFPAFLTARFSSRRSRLWSFIAPFPHALMKNGLSAIRRGGIATARDGCGPGRGPSPRPPDAPEGLGRIIFASGPGRCQWSSRPTRPFAPPVDVCRHRTGDEMADRAVLVYKRKDEGEDSPLLPPDAEADRMGTVPRSPWPGTRHGVYREHAG